jgi:superoxide dismutase, Cu-Zn family
MSRDYRSYLALFLGSTLLACSAPESAAPESENVGSTEQELFGVRSTVLRDAAGAFVGRVVFAPTGSVTTVSVSARLNPPQDGIHGFHVHANDNPANGDGCIADPAQPPNTHFVSADGHYNPGGTTHGSHGGDMPALFFTEDGAGAMSFITDRFDPAEIVGRAVILHAAPDNYGNVPVGAAANQYTPNSADATTLTANTGNAGNRIACGVIQ